MVKDVELEDLFDDENISSFPVLYLSSKIASEIMIKFRGQVIRTEMKDFLLIDGRRIAAIHIDDESIEKQTKRIGEK